MKRFVVVGLGNFGSVVAESLYKSGHDVTTVDTREEMVDRMAQRTSRAAVGDGRNIDVLRKIGADEADAAVVSTGDDLTASILAVLALRDLKVPEIYVKVISSDHARVMEKMGVTETIFPERESGIRLAMRLGGIGILNFIQIAPGVSIQEMAVPESWIGRTLGELELPKHYRISVVALYDVLHDEIVTVPDLEAPLKDSDTLLILGRDPDLAKLAKTG